jgi:hypothetical protein
VVVGLGVSVDVDVGMGVDVAVTVGGVGVIVFVGGVGLGRSPGKVGTGVTEGTGVSSLALAAANRSGISFASGSWSRITSAMMLIRTAGARLARRSAL